MLNHGLVVLWQELWESDPEDTCDQVPLGIYKFVNGCERNFVYVAGKGMKDGVEHQRLYWVEKASNNPSHLMGYQSGTEKFG
jgi:hypothetical protein